MSTENTTTPATAAPEATVEVPSEVPSETPNAPETPQTPLSKLTERLGDITKQADHGEMWGVQLSIEPSHVPTQVVLQKFLKANSNDPVAAEKQLIAALEWRRKTNPVALLETAFDRSRFEGLGFVTTHANEAGKETVITWNIYGSVKNKKATFADVAEFIKWRAALMELSVQQLRLNEATEVIPENGVDQYQMLQVHDYQSVSFFRMDSDVKAASKETIQTFSMAYPELLSHKYFVNVPAIMGWMFGAMKFFLAPATLKKFHPMTSGTTLSTELKDIASSLPSEYGGQGPSVKEGMTVILTEAVEEPEAEGADDASKKEDDAVAQDDNETTLAMRTKEDDDDASEEHDIRPTIELPTLDDVKIGSEANATDDIAAKAEAVRSDKTA